MKKVYLDDLPMNGKRIDWNNSVGAKIKFTYDGISGEVTILKYDKDKKHVVIKSNDFNNGDAFSLYVSSFKACQLGSFVDKNNRQYRFSDGENVKTKSIDVNIVKSCKKQGRKSYVCSCNKCRGVTIIREDQLLDENHGCGVCSNKVCHTGINDVATTHPHLVKYFLNTHDAKINSINSHNKVSILCPECGATREMSIIKFANNPFNCHVCSDGRSYPERFIAAILEYHGIKYVPQLTRVDFEWCDKYRYDFYLTEYDCIIEAHGRQHYEETTLKGCSLADVRRNDSYKRRLATLNGISNYYEIDCVESDAMYIFNNFTNSGITDVLGEVIRDTNIIECGELALKSKVIDVCNLWMSGIRSPKKISEMTGVSLSATRAYLRNGSKIGLCDYRK